MRKLRLDQKGLSPLVAVIVLLTLVMVLGAIIAGTLSGAPRPVLPATTAVNIMAPKGGNPAAGDDVLIIRHEYGAVIDDAWMYVTAEVAEMAAGADPPLDLNEGIYWCEMELRVNGEVVHPLIENATSNNVEVTEAELSQLSMGVLWALFLGQDPSDVDMGLMGCLPARDFALGDQLELKLSDELQSSDLIQVVWVPKDLMLVEYLVQ